MITAADADGIARLMTESHSFIDSVGHTVSGKAACCAAWRGFFEAFPTYRNEFDSVTERDGTVIMTGRSVCADDSDLDGPAVWTARTVGTLVSEWSESPNSTSLIATAGRPHAPDDHRVHGRPPNCKT
jgi:ketosteroid isomerase-like protein